MPKDIKYYEITCCTPLNEKRFYFKTTSPEELKEYANKCLRDLEYDDFDPQILELYGIDEYEYFADSRYKIEEISKFEFFEEAFEDEDDE